MEQAKLDEPAANLDFGNQSIVLNEVRCIAVRGASAIISTHDPIHTITVATCVVLVHEGRLIALASAPDIQTGLVLRAVYCVPVTAEALKSSSAICVPVIV